MSDRLKQLSPAQKKAIIMLACAVEAQSNNGKFTTNDPEVDMIARACFDNDWEGFHNPNFKHMFFGDAVRSDMDENIRIVSRLDDATKYAFKILLSDLAQDNAFRVIATASILHEVGFIPPKNPTPKKESTEKNVQEDDGTHLQENTFFGRIIDLAAIRGENDTVFTLMNNINDEGTPLSANYVQWLKHGVCPAIGLVGRSYREENTPEGLLRYMYCSLEREKCMIVPVLDGGLEEIDHWIEEDKRVNNRILAYDQSGERCRELRERNKNMPKPKRNYALTMAEMGKQIVHFNATHFERIEPGNNRPSHPQSRRIDFTYTKNGSEVVIEVLHVMRPRYAKIDSDDGVTLTYKDKIFHDAYYEVETSTVDGSIVRFSLFQLNERGQYKEMRYTI